jgi:iron complex outermembrane receptor protein
LRSDPQERFSFEVIGSVYSYLNDTQRMPGTTAAGLASGPGSITDMDGTGWATLDAKGLWRGGAHRLTFGAHGDRYELVNVRYNTSDWLHGGRGTVANAISGKTKTVALWAQDEWRLPRDVALTLGGRYEYWRAYDGTNFGPGLSVSQPGRTATGFSPKGTIAWGFAPNWTATGSFGVAYRFPTVAELYQAVTTGVVQASPNPTLRPERALSGEIALERRFTDGKIRLSLFEESLSDALIAQNTLLPGSTTTLVTFVQNVDKVESRGIELVGEKDDVLVRGLALQGSVTFVDSTIVKDSILPVAIGKQAPQVPSWRATLVATYRPDAQWVFTAAARYSNRVYATIDNSDIYTHTYQGFDSYFVVDLRARYAIDDHWSAALGIDNVNDDAYFLFHPFPQRTFHMEVKCAF